MPKNQNMKLYLTSFILLFTIATFAQTKIHQQAVIYTTMNIIAPEEEDVQNLQSNQEMRGGMNFRNMMDGETKFITYLKNDSIKTNIKSEMGRFAIYRDNNKKITTSIMEMMGNKMGFYTSDSEQVVMQKQRDSMMQERRKKDTSAKRTSLIDRDNLSTDIIKTNETKKIAGILCNKAFIVSTRFMMNKDTAIVWYAPDIKLKNLNSTGGFSNLPGMVSNMVPTLKGLDNVDGFVMGYTTKMRRNRILDVAVTKIELDKEIDNKEFSLPKDVELKPMREMRMMFGGGRDGFNRGGRD